jgi:4'-phosphopantetheinyl transferase
MTLADDEIHLWVSFERPEDKGALERLTAILQPEERAQLDAARSDGLRERRLAARAMQRTVLAGYTRASEPEVLRFVNGEFGKPVLAPGFDADGLHFNITHTDGLIAMAVSRHRDVGVDAEKLDARTTALRLARRYFTAAESRDLEALPPARQPLRFYSLWTLKEAWMKASGRGVGAGLDNASFALDDEHRVRELSLAANDAADWHFWQHAPSPEHVLALALRAPGAAPRMSVVTREWRPP